MSVAGVTTEVAFRGRQAAFDPHATLAKFLAADDASHHRTGIDTNAKRELSIAEFAFG
jgi:hypothetical protein